MDLDPCRLSRAGHHTAQGLADRMGKRDVRDQAFAEESRDATARSVEELIGDDDVHRRVPLLQRADRRGRNNTFDSQQFHRIDVGAKRQFGRHEAMAAPVSRQEGDARAFERPENEVVRRFAERSLDADLTHVGQTVHLIQTTAANDSNLSLFHYFFSPRLISRIATPCTPRAPGRPLRSNPATLTMKYVGESTVYFSVASSWSRFTLS